MKGANLLIIVLFLSGCVTHIPLNEQIPSIAYNAKDILVVTVVDNRRRVDAGKPRNFVGIAHGLFGIPSDWHIDPVLSVEEGDDDRDLSQFLQYRIVNGLRQKGWEVSSLDVMKVPTPTEAESLLKENSADTLLVLQLMEWYFSINLNWVSAFNFDTNSNVIIFKGEKDKVFTKNFSGRDVIDEKADQSHQNLILMAYREQLNEILNDPEVKAALIGN